MAKGNRPRGGGGGGGSPRERIENARTLSDAIQIADRAGIHTSAEVLRDVHDEQLIKDGLAEAAWVKEEFPIVGDIQITSDPSHKSAYMYSDLGSNTIAYAGFNGENTRMRANEYRAGAVLTDRNGLTDSPKGTTMKHVVTHEMGHQVVRAASDAIVAKATNGKYTTSTKAVQDVVADRIVQTAYQSMPTSQRGRRGVSALSKSISKYAWSGGSHETIAEALADYRANGNNAQPFSKSIYNTLKSFTTSSNIDALASSLR